jgi:replicative DNA helicase
LAEAGNSPFHRNIRLHDWASIRPFDIERAARRFGANIVFVDYLQIVTASDPRKNRNEQVGEITKALNEMARRMKVPVVVMAQIGRKAEEGKDPRPAMHHLRESGNIEQDCDMVCLLWRPEGGIHGTKGTAYDGDHWDAELDVAKVRLGAKARLRLDWDGERTAFTDHMTEQKEAF